jgi:hypothetical protein
MNHGQTMRCLEFQIEELEALPETLKTISIPFGSTDYYPAEKAHLEAS